MSKSRPHLFYAPISLSNKAAAAEDLKFTVIANAANPGGPNRKAAGALIGLPEGKRPTNIIEEFPQTEN